MGTVFELTLTVPCAQGEGREVFVAAQDLLDKIESELSLYQPESPLSRLNRDGKIANQYSHLSIMVKASLEALQKTEGAFNVAIEPILRKIRQSWKATGQAPSLAELQRLKPLVDLNQVRVDKDEIRLLRPGMALTFDGIAKGYAVDEVAHFLEESNIHNFLLNFSGNMRWKGSRFDGQAWKIAMWNPARQEIQTLAPRPSGAIASSGNEINFYSKNKRWHHLINPKTLMPAHFWQQTTVVGSSAQECDILSTASFVLEEKELRRIFHKNFPLVQVWVVDPQGIQRLLTY
jgi:thiamine biosynthesis lipoprotein